MSKSKKRKADKMSSHQIVEDYVPKYIDYDLLRSRCHQSVESFENGMFGEVIKTPNGSSYVYLKRGGKMLAVAHRDVVKSIADNKLCYVTGNRFFAPQLDDRLGVHLILDILPKYGIDFDILLTTDEEIGKSTARFFKTDVDYNFIFEIDRAGTDSVMYDFHTEEKEKLLESYGLDVGVGSFTDICELNDMERWAVNFACAYSGQHTSNCHVDVKTLEEKLLPKIIKFLQEQQNTKYTHNKNNVFRRYTSVYANNYYDYHQTTYYSATRWERMVVRNGRYVCEDCGRFAYECTGNTCLYTEPKKVDRICKVCTLDDCVGYKKCPICGFSFHRNKFIEYTGICYECLRDTFEIKPDVLAGLYSINHKVVTAVAEVINNKVDDIYAESYTRSS